MREKFQNFFKSEYFHLSLIFILAAGGRWLYYQTGFNPGFFHHGWPYGDALEYDILAMNLLCGKGFGHFLYGFKHQSFVLPLYPAFLAFLYSLFGHNYSVVWTVQFFIGILNCFLVYKIEKKIFNQKIGLISGLILAIYIPYMLLTFQLMRETLFNFLFALSVLRILEVGDKPSFKNAITCGIIIGLTSLTRPAGLILILVGIFWLPLKFKDEVCKPRPCTQGWGKGIKLAALVSLISLLVISPWLARNYLIHGGFVFETSGYRQFWTGANPKYRGEFYDREAWQEVLWKEPFSSEIEGNRRLNKEAWRFIQQNPQRYLKYIHKRFDNLWMIFYPEGENRLDLVNLSLLCSFFVFWSGLLGLSRAIFSWRKVSLFVFILILYSLSCAFYGGVARYRLPLEQILVVFAGYFLYLLFNINRFDWRNFREILVTPEFAEADLSLGSASVLKKTKRILLGFSVILLAIFVVQLSWAYFSYQPNYYLKPSETQIINALKTNEIYEEWLSQENKRLSYKDIFQDQVRHQGLIQETAGKIIIWSGEISYIHKTGGGEIYKFRLLLNPQAHFFGEEDVFCERAAAAKPSEHKNLKEGDIVTVIGRITRRNWLPERPCIEFYEIMSFNP